MGVNDGARVQGARKGSKKRGRENSGQSCCKFRWGLISANMLVAASLASAFTLPSRLPPLASSARCAVVHMADGDGKSDRYNFEDPRQILDNFFNPGGKRVPKVFTRGGRGGKDTGEPSRSSDGDLQEMLQDSCIDWGGLSAREVAAAFMMLKGGSLC